MSYIRGDGSFAHVELLYYDDDIHGHHDDDIHREHDYDHEEHESQCMPTKPANTSVLWCMIDIVGGFFIDIIWIFNFNMFLMY